MYDNKVHSVEHRIVSIPQPWFRPIVRGKVKTPVEFGAKFDLSLDSEGYGRIEKISFEAYNESSSLIEAAERFKDRTGYYPERVLADQIYRTRENRSYCKEHRIWLSGPKLGRPSATAKADKKQEYQDNADRIEVERSFSLSKRCYGMNCITTKLVHRKLNNCYIHAGYAFESAGQKTQA
jgi:IS5 family transposase